MGWNMKLRCEVQWHSYLYFHFSIKFQNIGKYLWLVKKISISHFQNRKKKSIMGLEFWICVCGTFLKEKLRCKRLDFKVKNRISIYDISYILLERYQTYFLSGHGVQWWYVLLATLATHLKSYIYTTTQASSFHNMNTTLQ